VNHVNVETLMSMLLGKESYFLKRYWNNNYFECKIIITLHTKWIVWSHTLPIYPKKQKHELTNELNIKGKVQGYIGDNLYL
jgi:hypothetical protein